MATNNTSSSNPRVENMGDVLDALSNGIAKTAANEPKFEPKLPAPEVPAEPARQLLTEIMLADRWVCSVARLQRWRTVGEGPQYLKIRHNFTAPQARLTSAFFRAAPIQACHQPQPTQTRIARNAGPVSWPLPGPGPAPTR